MKTSSPYYRSQMRPEYLAEFEEAGIDPYSHVKFGTETPVPAAVAVGKEIFEHSVLPSFPKPVKSHTQTMAPHGERITTRKVIIERPMNPSSTIAVLVQLVPIVVGLVMLFVAMLSLPAAFLYGIIRGASRTNRRSIW